MEKAFEIDIVRQVIYQTILQEYIKNPDDFIGRKDQIALTSFYEHLLSNEEIDRYVETVRDLNNQQNRTGLIANGIIVEPSNPTITNLNQCDIIPLEFTLNFRCTLANRDKVRYTLNNVITVLKGRKQDVAEFDNGKLFLVGTMGNNVNGSPTIESGDFIGALPLGQSLDTWINNTITSLSQNYLFTANVFEDGSYLYFETIGGKLAVAVYEYDSENQTYVWHERQESSDYPNIIFPPEHNSFVKWKVSLSFDSFRCTEPRTLNAEDYCDLIFGGSATIVSQYVLLGNELTKLSIKKHGVKTATGLDTTLTNGVNYYLEPLETPSGNNASTTANQLISNKFFTNSHTDGLTITRQYTFVMDSNIGLLKDLFLYARYGIQNNIAPNLLYKVTEYFSAWGIVNVYEKLCKIVENIDIENNESDVMTISLVFQLQGDND